MGSVGTYQLIEHGGAQIGGVYRAMDASKPPHWLTYIRVASADQAAAAAKAAGGRVTQGPMEVPGGSRVAQILDPQGGAFAVHELATQAAAAAAPGEKSAARPARSPAKGRKRPAKRASAARKTRARPATSRVRPGLRAVAKAKKRPAASRRARKSPARKKAAGKRPAARKAAGKKSARRSARKSARRS